MKLQHNLGGLENLGPVNFEKRVFVEPWEKRVFGIHVAMMALSKHLDIDGVPTRFQSEWTWADLRKAAEAMHPFEYFKYRYYEKWLGAIAAFFVGQGYISQQELESCTANFLSSPDAATKPGGGPKLTDQQAIDQQVIRYLRIGDSPRRSAAATPKYKPGDSVHIKDIPPTDHTRLPGYLRCKKGVIATVYEGAYTYFCKTADGLGEPMPVYCVRFDPVEVWGGLAEENTYVYADVFETYIKGPL